MENNFTFNGISFEKFEEAIKVVCDFFNGVAATPLSEEMQPVLVITGLQGMMLDSAHRNFIRKLKELSDHLQERTNLEKTEDCRVCPQSRCESMDSGEKISQ